MSTYSRPNPTNTWGKKATPASSTSAKSKVSPAKRLSKKNDDGTWYNCNLFSKVSKAGKNYLSGWDKENKIGFAFFENQQGGILIVNDTKIELKKFSNEDGSIAFVGGGYRVTDYKSRASF